MNKNTTVVLIIVVGALILGLLIFSAILSKPSSELNTQIGSGPTPTPSVLLVPFDYTVKSVSANTAILNGAKGDITIPNDPKVSVFKGTPPNAVASSFSEIKVGQKIKLELSPGVGIKVYILQ